MRTVDIFAGAGGFSLGALRAGCELVACVERDTAACATSRAAGRSGIVSTPAGWPSTSPPRLTPEGRAGEGRKSRG